MGFNTEKLHAEALKRFDEINSSFEQEQRTLAVNDMLFLHSENGQWEELATQARVNRPKYTIDRISGALDQIIGDYRQSRINIKVVPCRSGSEAVAHILTGLIKNIERSSSGGEAYDNAFRETAEGGFGGWRVFSEFESDDAFEQKLGIEPVFSAASSLFFDPDSKKRDRSDSLFAFLITSMTRSAFKLKWPDADVESFEDSSALSQSKASWFNKELDEVKVAEYWYKKPVEKEIAFLSDGRTIDLDEERSVLDELAAEGVNIVRSRIISSYKIFSVVMNGVEFLTDPAEWMGKFIPLIPVFGKTAVIDSKFFSRGIVRKAVDAQRIYNYATSSGIEATALTPKDPIWMTPKQAEGHEQSLTEFPVKNTPFLFYNPDPEAPGAPQRGGAPQLQNSLLQQISQASFDIHAVTGIEPASMGNVPELKSGKAIVNQQKMGDRGAFVFRDNLAKAIAYTGKILIDLIPRIYDTERVVQIMGDDDKIKDVIINEKKVNSLNQPVLDSETGRQVIVNDLSQGEYSVTATAGPSYSTQRAETVEQLSILAGQSQKIQDLAIDIIVKNMDLNHAEELDDRLRRDLIQKGIIIPTEEDIKKFGLDQKPPEDPMNTALMRNVQAQTEKLLIDSQKVISEVEKNDADTQFKIMQTQEKAVDSLLKTLDLIKRKQENGIPVTEQDLELLKGQKAIVEEFQKDVILGSELAASPRLG